MDKDPAVSETEKPVARAKEMRYVTPLTRVLAQEKEGFFSSDTAFK